VAQKPNAEENSGNDHARQYQGVGTDPENVLQQRPDAQGNQNRDAITDRDVGKKVSALAHEEVAADWAAARRVEVSVENRRVVADWAAQMDDRRQTHTLDST